MKVINEITIYEINGLETGVGAAKKLTVESHNFKNMVIIKLNCHDNECNLTVRGSDLTAAVTNAQNSK